MSDFKRLGDVLVANNLVTEKQLQESLKIQTGGKKRLGEVLIDQGYITEIELIKTLEKQLNIKSIKINDIDIMPEVPNLISEKLARRHELIPVLLDDNILTLAMIDPINMYAKEDISLMTGYQIKAVMSTRREILDAIDRYYNKTAAEEIFQEFNENYQYENYDEEISESSLAEINNAPIVKLLNSIIEQAIKIKASDIHIEPLEKNVRVRYRIDGDLIESITPAKTTHSAIVTRIKIMAKLDIAEKRVPQDGKVEINIAGHVVDLRISIISTIHGEKVVIRLLDRSSRVHSEEDIGFSEINKAKFDRLIKNPNGIVLMTGPTGSGKTTTLYAALTNLNEISKNIITIEDPVEYRMDGIIQTQINNKAKVTFASGLRSILRQDPDIIMIGEIRDAETAEIAVRAAITGHLVFSTVHTNDTASTVARLVDMGIEPFLLSSALVGIVAQRLVKKLCDNCKYTYAANDVEANLLGVEPSTRLFASKGCSHCNNTGYSGRTAIHEILAVTSKIREFINNGRNTDEIKNEAIAEGMITLREDVGRLVLEGITSVEEMLRITYKVD